MYDAHRADAVFATSQQERHAVALIDFPTVFGDAQQPPFGYQPVEERKEYRATVGFRCERKCETDGLGMAGCQEIPVVDEKEAVLVLRECARHIIEQIYFCPFHDSISFLISTG